MRYILPTDALDKLALLRFQYQKDKKINIENQPSMIGMPTMFGGTDVASRKKQIVFLEKIMTVLGPNLKKLEQITSPEEQQASTTAWRVYLSACWYVQSQNSNNSTLNSLINHDLGITTENYPDEEDKQNCFATANRFVNTKNALEDVNVALIKAKQRPYTEKEWAEFTDYLGEHGAKNTVSPLNPYANYPITSVTQPLFRTTFAYTGATVGLLSGDVISKTTKAMSVKYQLTALLGGSLLLFSPVGPTGVALFAPVVVSKLISTFCSITLAHVLGVSMGILGDKLGQAVGVPLDWAYQFLWKVCALIGGYCYKEPGIPLITGIRISDGSAVINGIVVNITPLDQIAELDKKQIIELKDDGSMYVDGKAIITANSGVQLPANVIDELKEHLKIFLPLPAKETGQETDSKDIELVEVVGEEQPENQCLTSSVR